MKQILSFMTPVFYNPNNPLYMTKQPGALLLIAQLFLFRSCEFCLSSPDI